MVAAPFLYPCTRAEAESMSARKLLSHTLRLVIAALVGTIALLVHVFGWFLLLPTIDRNWGPLRASVVVGVGCYGGLIAALAASRFVWKRWLRPVE
jgi:hypothetical protein